MTLLTPNPSQLVKVKVGSRCRAKVETPPNQTAGAVIALHWEASCYFASSGPTHGVARVAVDLTVSGFEWLRK